MKKLQGNLNQSELIETLKVMPKHCRCSTCLEIKEKAKLTLGNKYYKRVAKSLDISFV